MSSKISLRVSKSSSLVIFDIHLVVISQVKSCIVRVHRHILTLMHTHYIMQEMGGLVESLTFSFIHILGSGIHFFPVFRHPNYGKKQEQQYNDIE